MPQADYFRRVWATVPDTIKSHIFVAKMVDTSPLVVPGSGILAYGAFQMDAELGQSAVRAPFPGACFGKEFMAGAQMETYGNLNTSNPSRAQSRRVKASSAKPLGCSRLTSAQPGLSHGLLWWEEA